MAEQDLMVMGVSREAVERMVSSVVEAFMVNSGALRYQCSLCHDSRSEVDVLNDEIQSI